MNKQGKICKTIGFTFLSIFGNNWLLGALPIYVNSLSSSASAMRLKETLPKLISFEQTAYVKNRFIRAGGRLNSDILEMPESVNLKGYIVTVDTEKGSDSLSNFFKLGCLKNCGYGNDFIKWIEMLLECQQFCIINGGNATKYFKIQKR